MFPALRLETSLCAPLAQHRAVAGQCGCWPVTVYAVEMGLSPHTVRNHSTNLRRKLNVRSSLEAVIAAVRLGVLTLDEDRRETNVS